MLLVIDGTQYELSALKNPASFTKILVILAFAAAIAIWRTHANAHEASLQFEDAPEPEVFALGLYRDGAIPIPNLALRNPPP